MAAAESSHLQAFVSLFRKLANEEFASEKIRRYGIIRSQIETLLNSTEGLKCLCDALEEELGALLSRLPERISPLFEVALWPQFHTFRVNDAPRIWKTALKDVVPQVDPVLMQRATMEFLMVLILSRHSTIATDIPNLMTSKQDRMKNMSFEEKNAIRYAAGYVLRKLRKVYEEKSVAVCQFLMEMKEDEEDLEVNDDNLLSYTRSWIDITNRGGLYQVKDELYTFFQELEIAIYPLLRSRLEFGDSKTKEQVIRQVTEDEDVLFNWEILTVHLSAMESSDVLYKVVDLWMTIRGFSIASKLLEDYKASTKKTTTAKKALRKQLITENKQVEN